MKESIISNMLFQKSKADESGKVEPLRALNGIMQGHTVKGQFARRGRAEDFSFIITKADYANGQLHLQGRLTAARLSEEATALFGGAIIRPYNPWPGPSEEFRKEDTKDDKGVTLERNEQTQSLYPPPSQIAGCEVFFLSMTPSSKMRTSIGSAEKIQIGVSLSSFDNRTGEAISRQIWNLLRLKSESAEAKAGIAELNRLLGS